MHDICPGNVLLEGRGARERGRCDRRHIGAETSVTDLVAQDLAAIYQTKLGDQAEVEARNRTEL